jgi:hypothetical protein
MVRMEIQNTQLCLMGSAETSKQSVMRFSRLLFQLAPLEPRTEGTGCGLLHTPSSQEPGVDSERLVTKEGEPAKVGERAYDRTTGRLAQVGLPQQIGMLLKTPTGHEAESEHRKSKGISGTSGTLAQEMVSGFILNRLIPIPSKAVGASRGLKLQPAFVEWMMGFPLGFTDIEFKGSRPSGTR